MKALPLKAKKSSAPDNVVLEEAEVEEFGVKQYRGLHFFFKSSLVKDQ